MVVRSDLHRHRIIGGKGNLVWWRVSRSRRIRKVSAWIFVGAMLICLRSTAGPPPLRYEVPTANAEAERCPSAGDFRDALAARLGHDPFAPADAPSAWVHVERTKAGLSGRLRLTPREGAPVERTLVGERCDELVRAMAVTLAVMLDPLGEHFVPEPPPASPVPEPAQAPASPPLPPAREVAAPPPKMEGPRLRYEAEAGASGSAGLFPALGLGGWIAFGLHRAPWSIRLEGRFDGIVGEAEVANGQRAKAALVGGGLVGCYEVALLFGCVVTTAASYRARAEFVTTPSTRSAFWLAAGLRLGTALRIGSSSWIVPHVEGIIPLLRSNLEVDDGRVLWEAPPVAVTFGLAARTRFPE
jgi:hypothetical protein